MRENNYENRDKDALINRGDPFVFSKWKLNFLLINMVYPHVYSRIISSVNNIKEATRLLKKIGYDSGVEMAKYLNFKSKNIKNLIKEIINKSFNMAKVKIIEEKDNIQYKIIVDMCPLCFRKEYFETTEIKYCQPFSGYLESIINIIEKRKTNEPKIRYVIEILKSIGSGDEHCEYLLTKKIPSGAEL